MFLKICHFEEGSKGYDLHEGSVVRVIWEDKKKKTPLTFIVDDEFIELCGSDEKEIFIMSNKGKTIERITKRSELSEKQHKEQMKK